MHKLRYLLKVVDMKVQYISFDEVLSLKIMEQDEQEQAMFDFVELKLGTDDSVIKHLY